MSGGKIIQVGANSVFGNIANGTGSYVARVDDPETQAWIVGLLSYPSNLELLAGFGGHEVIVLE